jgi:hypothetical protein
MSAKSVVLPAPFGPMSAVSVPGCTARADVLHRLQAAKGDATGR